jgi:hypothetical protein
MESPTAAEMRPEPFEKLRTALVEGRPVPQWCEVDIALIGPDVANPDTDVDAWVIFTHASGRQLRRPVFWDGGTTYRVRASHLPNRRVSGSGVFTLPNLIMTSSQRMALWSPARQSEIIRIERLPAGLPRRIHPAAASATPTGRQRSG